MQPSSVQQSHSIPFRFMLLPASCHLIQCQLQLLAHPSCQRFPFPSPIVTRRPLFAGQRQRTAQHALQVKQPSARKTVYVCVCVCPCPCCCYTSCKPVCHKLQHPDHCYPPPPQLGYRSVFYTFDQALLRLGWPHNNSPSLSFADRWIIFSTLDTLTMCTVIHMSNNFLAKTTNLCACGANSQTFQLLHPPPPAVTGSWPTRDRNVFVIFSSSCG